MSKTTKTYQFFGAIFEYFRATWATLGRPWIPLGGKKKSLHRTTTKNHTEPTTNTPTTFHGVAGLMPTLQSGVSA